MQTSSPAWLKPPSPALACSKASEAASGDKTPSQFCARTSLAAPSDSGCVPQQWPSSALHGNSPFRGAGSNGNHFGRNGSQFSGLGTGTSRDCNRNRSQHVIETRPPSSRNRNRKRNPGAQISQSGEPKTGPSPGQLFCNLLVPRSTHFLLELPLVLLLYSFCNLLVPHSNHFLLVLALVLLLHCFLHPEPKP